MQIYTLCVEFFQGTIATDGFPMVLSPSDHHHVFSQVNHWKRWFFDGFPNLGYNGYQWFRSWKKGNIVAFQTFEILQQF